MQSTTTKEIRDYEHHQRDAAIARLRTFVRLVESGVDVKKVVGADAFVRIFESCDLLEQHLRESDSAEVRDFNLRKT